MKEAVAKMKDELGDDAVILHTKKYKEGGLLGLGSEEMVEITAAIEDERPAPKKEPEIPQRTSSLMPPSVLSQYKTNGTPEGVAMAERELNLSSREDEETSLDTLNSTNEENKLTQESSMMNPTITQASSLEEAMKPGNKPSRPDPPMPYDDEPSTIPYELEISSKPEVTSPPDVENKEFVHSQSELEESVAENEPDENVYTAEPSKSDVTYNINDNSQGDQSIQNVQPYNDKISVVETSTTQINTMQVATDTTVSTQHQPPEQNIQPVQNIESQNISQPLAGQSIQQPQHQVQIQQNLNQPQDVQQMQQPQLQPQPQPQPQPQQTQIYQQNQQISQQPVNNNQIPMENLSAQPAEQMQTNSNEQISNNQQQQLDVNQPLTPAQLAQAQAMMMAQFNQMQMAQVMQQAVAQAQAQAQEQVRQAYLQAQTQAQSQVQSPPQSNEHIQKPVNSSNDTQIADHGSQVKIKKLENEIAQMKALLAQVIGKESNHGLSLHEALRRQEINEDILNDMAAHAEAGETLADSQSREAKSTLVKFLKENINFSEGVKLNRHGVRIVALLGTTGVGKTTTLAKIAAKFVLEQGITAALITADTYRISAVEQLRTYSDILGLPLEIVYSPNELSRAINKYRNRDLILIDTAGRSQHNDYQMKELQDFLATNQRIEKHLVLSTTTKSSDANDILEKFAVCEPDKIIFTKTDETARVGLIVNLLFKKKLSISYVTNGQSVPDDITPASAEVLAELLLRKEI